VLQLCHDAMDQHDSPKKFFDKLQSAVGDCPLPNCWLETAVDAAASGKRILVFVGQCPKLKLTFEAAAQECSTGAFLAHLVYYAGDNITPLLFDVCPICPANKKEDKEEPQKSASNSTSASKKTKEQYADTDIWQCFEEEETENDKSEAPSTRRNRAAADVRL
jgi:hypothetical protein